MLLYSFVLQILIDNGQKAKRCQVLEVQHAAKDVVPVPAVQIHQDDRLSEQSLKCVQDVLTYHTVQRLLETAT